MTLRISLQAFLDALSAEQRREQRTREHAHAPCPVVELAPLPARPALRAAPRPRAPEEGLTVVRGRQALFMELQHAKNEAAMLREHLEMTYTLLPALSPHPSLATPGGGGLFDPSENRQRRNFSVPSPTVPRWTSKKPTMARAQSHVSGVPATY